MKKIKRDFYFVWISAALLSPAAFAAAQNDLAERFYRIGNRQAALQQWEKAREAYFYSVLLNASLAGAVKRKTTQFPLNKEAAKTEDETAGAPAPALPETSSPLLPVKNLLEEGRTEEAVLALTHLLREDPQNERARLWLEKLKSAEEGLSLTDDAFKKGEALMAEAKALEEAGKRAQAYRRCRQVQSLFADRKLKPYFFRELTERLKTLEQSLSAELDAKLEELPAGALEKNAETLRNYAQYYPMTSRLDALLKELYTGLEAKALPLLLSAKTLQELEGCQTARPLFQKVLVSGRFPEVPSFAEAHKNLQACPLSQPGIATQNKCDKEETCP